MSEEEQRQIFLDLLKHFTALSTELEAVRTKKQRWVEEIFKVTEALQSKRGRLASDTKGVTVDGRGIDWPDHEAFASLLADEDRLSLELHSTHDRIRRFEWGQKIQLALPPDDHPYQYHPTIMT